MEVASHTLANKLITAADTVYRIGETTSIKVSMQQIYDSIPDTAIFEAVRDDIQNGVVQIPGLSEIGFTLRHDQARTMVVYAIINDQRQTMGEVDVFSIPAMSTALTDVMVDYLIANVSCSLPDAPDGVPRGGLSAGPLV